MSPVDDAHDDADGPPTHLPGVSPVDDANDDADDPPTHLPGVSSVDDAHDDADDPQPHSPAASGGVGKQSHDAHDSSDFLRVGLLNARSVGNKCDNISEMIIDKDLIPTPHPLPPPKSCGDRRVGKSAGVDPQGADSHNPTRRRPRALAVPLWNRSSRDVRQHPG